MSALILAALAVAGLGWLAMRQSARQDGRGTDSGHAASDGSYAGGDRDDRDADSSGDDSGDGDGGGDGGGGGGE